MSAVKETKRIYEVDLRMLIDKHGLKVNPEQCEALLDRGVGSSLMATHLGTSGEVAEIEVEQAEDHQEWTLQDVEDEVLAMMGFTP